MVMRWLERAAWGAGSDTAKANSPLQLWRSFGRASNTMPHAQEKHSKSLSSGFHCIMSSCRRISAQEKHNLSLRKPLDEVVDFAFADAM